jgi:hypothetical protein
MAFQRRTSVFAADGKGGKHLFGWLFGHWRVGSAANWARRMGANGEVRIEHQVIDLSGRGRGSCMGRFRLIIQGDAK